MGGEAYSACDQPGGSIPRQLSVRSGVLVIVAVAGRTLLRQLSARQLSARWWLLPGILAVLPLRGGMLLDRRHETVSAGALAVELMVGLGLGAGWGLTARVWLDADGSPWSGAPEPRRSSGRAVWRCVPPSGPPGRPWGWNRAVTVSGSLWPSPCWCEERSCTGVRSRPFGSGRARGAVKRTRRRRRRQAALRIAPRPAPVTGQGFRWREGTFRDRGDLDLVAFSRGARTHAEGARPVSPVRTRPDSAHRRRARQHRERAPAARFPGHGENARQPPVRQDGGAGPGAGGSLRIRTRAHTVTWYGCHLNR